MTMVPYLPSIGDSFETAIDRLFDEAVHAAGRPSFMPACTMWEDDKGYTVQLALPGVEPKDVEVYVEIGVCTIKGERKGHPEAGKVSRVLREIPTGAFARSLSLPTSVDHGAAKASYRDGILTIEFPKLESAKPRRLMIDSQ